MMRAWYADAYENSTLRDTVRRLAHPSLEETPVRRWIETSLVVGLDRDARASVPRWVRRSRTGRALSALDRRLVAASSSSVVVRTLCGPAGMGGSQIYRWLAERPESERIDTDPRETLILGSMLETVDRMVDALGPARDGSVIARLLGVGGDDPRSERSDG